MNALFPSGDPFEMLDNICNVDLTPVYTGLLQGFVEHSPSRADKGMAGSIFAVSGLFAHEDDLCCDRPFSEYSLCARLPERTCFATCGNFPQRIERGGRRYE